MTMEQLREDVWKAKPLIHCITNPISIHQCANAILAVGGRPMMAEHPEEVKEITATAKALLLNTGNITDARMESMKIAAKEAGKRKIPIVLDAVGVASSSLRRNYVISLLKDNPVAVLKGNYSEIYALFHEEYRALGVDADGQLEEETVLEAIKALSYHYDTVVLASGKVDLITNGRDVITIENGTERLGWITGTGCMLGALCATYLARGNAIDASIVACGMVGICGELAEGEKGSGSFLIRLMDELSTISNEELRRRLRMEVH